MTRLLLSILFLGALQPALPARTQAAQEYILILEDAPIARHVGSRFELRSAQAASQGARIEQAQQRVRQALAARKFRVVASVSTLLNAVFVRAGKRDVPVLRAMPGVKAVVPSRRFKMHMNSAASLVRAPQAWAALKTAGEENPGAGIKIGIIDSGIDQTHPAFQDTSLQVPAGYPICSGANCDYTNKKVIVARSYVPMLAEGYTEQPALTSSPDDLSPRDRVGHGTSTALVAAGMETKGPLATISGIAPKAFLGNYKVFGSPGVNDGASSSAILKALDDAYNDGMDIVSMSLGSTAWYGPNDKGAICGLDDADAPCEPEAQAVETAVSKGMVVVVSAGNEGDLGANTDIAALASVGTPGIAPSAITVGGSENGHEFLSRVIGSGSNAPADVKSIRASFGDGVVPTKPLTAPLVDANGLGCLSMPSSTHGAIVLIQRGNCNFSEKLTNAENAGAVGVVFYCNDVKYCADGGERLFSPSGLYYNSIPAVLVGMTDGRKIKTYANSYANPRVTLDPAKAEFPNPAVNTMADFSSRGPSIAPETALKPELVAIGTSIYSAAQEYDANGALYDASRYAVVNGTSFSAPMVAGAAALVLQKNPDFKPAQVKSALVNTAAASVIENGSTARVTAMGAGQLNAEAAVQTNVTVQPSTLPFGAITAVNSADQKRTLTIANHSTSVLALAVEQRDPDPNRFQLSAATVAAGKTVNVDVTFKGGMPVPGSYEGAITVKGGAVNLRVPYHYVVGDGVPYNIIPLTSPTTDGNVGALIPGLATVVRVIDRYGVGVAHEPIAWATGGASIAADPDCSGADSETDDRGIAGACIQLGIWPDDQEQIFATVGSGNSQLSYTFTAYTLAWPTIMPGGVVNTASWTDANGGKPAFSPGSYISILGDALCYSGYSAWFEDYLPAAHRYLPLSLSGVSVSFDSGNVSVPGRLSYVDPYEVDVQIPWELAGKKTVDLKVTLGNARSNIYTIPLAVAAPGIFEFDYQTHEAAVQHADFTEVSSDSPAARSEWIVVYLNGLGPVSNAPGSGEVSPLSPLSDTVNGVSVTIGGKAVKEVYFAGLSPLSIGLYQVNVKVPADAPTGLQDMVVTVNGNSSPAAKVTIK